MRAGACLAALLSGLATASGCDSRTTPVGDASFERHPEIDWRRVDRSADGPMLRVDGRREGGAADGPPFCGGPPQATVGGMAVPVSQVTTGIQVAASCCGPGESIRFHGGTAAGTFTINFQMVRFPNVPAATHLDLGNLPSGWFVSVECNLTALCGGPYIRPDNSTLSGTVDLTPAGAIPQETLTLCLSSTPNGTMPGLKPIRLSVTGVLVHLVCAPGMDQMCNNDPSISSLRGKCNDDSTCTCNPGATLVPSTGKCQ